MNMKVSTGFDERVALATIEPATAEVRAGGLPFVTTIVTSAGSALAPTPNRVVEDSDPTAHAEVAAIRDATTRLGRGVLKGLTLYTSCSPCALCYVSAFYAGVETIYFTVTRLEAESFGCDRRGTYEVFPFEAEGWATDRKVRRAGRSPRTFPRMNQVLEARSDHSEVMARSFQAYLTGGPTTCSLEPGLALSFSSFTTLDTAGWQGRRAAEYFAGRVAAREALLTAGHHRQADLEPAPSGAALWPPGFSGSISHAADHAAAAAWSAAGPIGVDIEASGRVPGRTLSVFSSGHQLAHLPRGKDSDLATLVFSAKEAAFKALPPSLQPATIRDIEVRFDDFVVSHGRFRTWQHDSPGSFHTGFFATTPTFVLTLVIALPPVGSSAPPASPPTACHCG